jgi:hypothetical protein
LLVVSIIAPRRSCFVVAFRSRSCKKHAQRHFRRIITQSEKLQRCNNIRTKSEICDSVVRIPAWDLFRFGTTVLGISCDGDRTPFTSGVTIGIF